MKQFDVFATDNMLYYNSYFPADKQVVFEESTQQRQPFLWLWATWISEQVTLRGWGWDANKWPNTLKPPFRLDFLLPFFSFLAFLPLKSSRGRRLLQSIPQNRPVALKHLQSHFRCLAMDGNLLIFITQQQPANSGYQNIATTLMKLNSVSKAIHMTWRTW